METFMKLMQSMKEESSKISKLAFKDEKSSEYAGIDCLQPMADNIQVLNKKEE